MVTIKLHFHAAEEASLPSMDNSELIYRKTCKQPCQLEPIVISQQEQKLEIHAQEEPSLLQLVDLLTYSLAHLLMKALLLSMMAPACNDCEQ